MSIGQALALDPLVRSRSLDGGPAEQGDAGDQSKIVLVCR